MAANPLPDNEIQEILDSDLVSHRLGDSLIYAIGDYVRTDRALFEKRNEAFYQSFLCYSPTAPWWQKLLWRFVHVSIPDCQKPLSFYDAVEWFGIAGKEKLFGKLKSGEFCAYGYLTPRKHGDKRVTVPIDVWGEDMLGSGIDWERSTVTGNGLTFYGVRIIATEFLTDDTPFKSRSETSFVDVHEEPSASLPAGPLPSEMTYVKRDLSMVERLDFVVNSLADEITTNGRTIYYKMIRAKFSEIYPDMPKPVRGLGDEYLRQALERLEKRRCSE
jgi:hypothetical protein